MSKLFKKIGLVLFVIAAVVSLFASMANNKISVYEISSNEKIVYDDAKTLDSSVYQAYVQRTSNLQGYTNVDFRSFNVDKIVLAKGRLPQRADELIVSKNLVKDFEYELGDKLIIDGVSYKIVGVDDDSDYSYYVCCLPECFNKLSPEKIVVKIKGKHSIDDVLDSVLADLKIKREEDLVKISDEQIKQLANKYNFYNDAINKTIEEYEDQLKDAEELLFTNQIQINNYRQILSDYERQLSDAKVQLDDSKATLVEAERMLSDSKNQLANARNELSAKLSEAGVNESELERAIDLINQAKAHFNVGDDELYALIDSYVKKYDDLQSLISLCIRASDLLKQASEAVEGSEYYDEFMLVYNQIEVLYADLKAFLSGTVLEKTVVSLENIITRSKELIDIINKYSDVLVYVDKVDQIREAISARNQINNGQNLYDQKYNEYLAGQAKYDASLLEYENGVNELQSKKNEFNKALVLFENAKVKYKNDKSAFDEKVKEENKEVENLAKDLEDERANKELIRINWHISECVGVSYLLRPIIKMVLLWVFVLVFGLFVIKILERNEKKDSIA